MKFVVVSFLLLAGPIFGQEKAAPFRLSVPPKIYAVPGVPVSLYFQNAVPSQKPDGLKFEVKCTVGEVEERRWTLTANHSQVGEHDLTLTATSADGGQKFDSVMTKIVVVPQTAGGKIDREIRLVIVGDSLTNASLYPNELFRLLRTPGYPQTRFIGRHHPAAAAEGVWHEGYGGWTWARFISKWEPGNTAKDKTGNSPFLFRPEGAIKPELDFRAYFGAHCDGRPPDYVIILLGINDCFHPDPKDPEAVKARIDLMLENAEIFLAALRKAAPETQIGVCLTTPPNLREEAFEANYKGKYTQRGWRRIQFELVEREIEHFKNREDENIFLVPTSLNLDPLNGYPVGNGVHPNAAGYTEIANSIYGWLKSRFSSQK